jgi:hypothetical protein
VTAARAKIIARWPAAARPVCEVAGDQPRATFDVNALRELRDAQEVAIQTEKHPKSAVVIWMVVADDEVFVRSWRGAKRRSRGCRAGYI